MKFIVIALAFLLTGCATPRSAIYPGHLYPPTNARDIQIYSSFPPDPQSYKVIGEVNFPDDVIEISASFVNSQFKQEAAKRGADAIVLQRENAGTTVHQAGQTQSQITQGFFQAGSVTKRIHGYLLKFTNNSYDYETNKKII